MKVARAEAWREVLKGLWHERATVGGYFGVLAGWMALFGCAWWASGAVGLGADWSTARLAISCSGAACEVFLALFMPLLGLMGDDDHLRSHGYNGYYHGYHHGHRGCHVERSGGRGDGWALAIACAMGLLVLGLDLARFAAPWMSWAPDFLQGIAGAWWLVVDFSITAAAGSLWLFAGAIGAGDIHRKATDADAKRLSQIETEALGRACRSPCQTARSSARRL